MSQAIKQLIQGYMDFRETYFHNDNSLYKRLAEQGQQPKILVIACSDSRVDPALVMNCQPGDLFVVRNVANLVPPFESDNGYHGTSAALEFAVHVLQIEHIILFGHTQCGGIRALIESEQHLSAPHSLIAKWMDLAAPARHHVMTEHADASLDEKITLCEQYALINSLHNLDSFPWIKEKVQHGKLALHAWYFDLAHGLIKAYSNKSQSFEALTQEMEIQ